METNKKIAVYTPTLEDMIEVRTSIGKYVEFCNANYLDFDKNTSIDLNNGYYCRVGWYLENGYQVINMAEWRSKYKRNVIFKDELGNNVYDKDCPVYWVYRDLLEIHLLDELQQKFVTKKNEAHAYFINKSDAENWIEEQKEIRELRPEYHHLITGDKSAELTTLQRLQAISRQLDILIKQNTY